MIRALMAAALIGLAPIPAALDDFSGELTTHWIVNRPADVHIIDSRDPVHGRVLELVPDGDDVYALVKGSEQWPGGVLEGDVRFPSNEDNYLGLIYNFQRQSDRTDFGVIYIKGNESYAQANPHYDFNVSRTLYPEYRVPLTGAAAIKIGEWQHFKLEVSGGRAHLYVGDMTTPQMTFPMFGGRGALGLQPRSVGGPVWVDNVRWRQAPALTYQGPDRPAVRYQPERLLTSWTAAGPFDRVNDAFAREPAKREWRPFAADPRGAVVTGRLNAFHDSHATSYFRTRIPSSAARQAVLALSTVDDLALWVNGRFAWFIPRAAAAWHDFLTNPQHAGQRIPIDLAAGENEIVLRARGGSYATGGFFAAIELPITADELARDGRYADVVAALDRTLQSPSLDATERRDLENRRAMYASVADVAPQQVSVDGGGRALRLSINPLGTWNSPVTIGGQSSEWLFDTGANLSTLSESEARRLGLALRDTTASIRGSTGVANRMRMAVAPAVEIGSARITNVLFLVLPDEALYIAPLRHQIRGIVGMPVLRALGAFAVSSQGEVTIQPPSPARSPNMTWDGWSAIVIVEHRGKTLKMLVDSGANATTLNAAARRALSSTELASAIPSTQQTGGVGALVTQTADRLHTFDLSIDGRSLVLENISVMPARSDQDSKESPYDGVLGTDALRHGFSIDFHAMRLSIGIPIQ